MNCNLNLIKSGFIIVMLTFLFPISIVFSQTDDDKKQKPDEPQKGISVTLTVYSGNPNPQWWITEGLEFEKLDSLLNSMKAVDDSLFDYSKWNRLGYASFMIKPREIKGLPYLIHIWRDMAYITPDKEGGALYAIGVIEIYDMLVAQAEKRGHRKFFLKYHEEKNNKE